MRRRPEVIYYHEDHELVILISPWDSKIEALQRWSTQKWSGPFPTRHGAAAFFVSVLPTVLWKSGLHHYLYAFMNSTKISLESIKLYSNQILCSTHEQSDFRTSISYFSFFFLPYFPFSLSLFWHFFQIFFLSYPLILTPKPNQKRT